MGGRRVAGHAGRIAGDDLSSHGHRRSGGLTVRFLARSQARELGHRKNGNFGGAEDPRSGRSEPFVDPAPSWDTDHDEIGPRFCRHAEYFLRDSAFRKPGVYLPAQIGGQRWHDLVNSSATHLCARNSRDGAHVRTGVGEGRAAT